METAVNISGEMFQQAEELAAALGISRDELFSQALAEFINGHLDEIVTKRLNQVYAKTDSELDPALKQLQAVSVPAERW